MVITHSYIGTSVGKYKCIFYMIYEDYIETQFAFVKELKKILVGFARNLGSSAALIEPFVDDISKIKQQVLNKSWSKEALCEISNTPGILMINVDFNIFNPQNDPWIYFHFGDKQINRYEDHRNIDKLLQKLANIVNDENRDIFKEAQELKKINIDILSVFEAKPGVFGFSIDIEKGIQEFSKFYNNIKNKRRNI